MHFFVKCCLPQEVCKLEEDPVLPHLLNSFQCIKDFLILTPASYCSAEGKGSSAEQGNRLFRTAIDKENLDAENKKEKKTVQQPLRNFQLILLFKAQISKLSSVNGSPYSGGCRVQYSFQNNYR